MPIKTKRNWIFDNIKTEISNQGSALYCLTMIEPALKEIRHQTRQNASPTRSFWRDVQPGGHQISDIRHHNKNTSQ